MKIIRGYIKPVVQKEIYVRDGKENINYRDLKQNQIISNNRIFFKMTYYDNLKDGTTCLKTSELLEVTGLPLCLILLAYYKNDVVEVNYQSERLKSFDKYGRQEKRNFIVSAMNVTKLKEIENKIIRR